MNHSNEVRTELDVVLREAFARPMVGAVPTTNAIVCAIAT